MALTQRQLADCAEEALQCAQALDELTGALHAALETSGASAEAKLALVQHLLGSLPVVSTMHSEAALAHIARTSARNAKRAEAARRLRATQKERNVP